MFFRFSTQKIVQAAGVLLRLEKGRMGYLRLLKLLYMADRESLRKTRRPIIGTRPVAMQKGPMHSEVYDLIKGEHIDEPLWSKYIRRDGHELELIKDPGCSELSRAEISILTETSDQYYQFDDFDLVNLAHQFPEWDKNYPNKNIKTSRTIPFDDLIDAVGLTAEKESILQDAREDVEIERLFAIAHRQ